MHWALKVPPLLLRDWIEVGFEAGTEHATCASPPGIRVAGTAICASRAPRGCCIARRGHGRATSSPSPRKLRPKRYLGQQSKQVWSRLPTQKPTLAVFFLYPGRDLAWSGRSSLSRRSFARRASEGRATLLHAGRVEHCGTSQLFKAQFETQAGGVVARIAPFAEYDRRASPTTG